MTEEEIMIISLRDFTKAKWRKLKRRTVELRDRAKVKAKDSVTKENFKNFSENIKNKIVDFYNKIVYWLRVAWERVKAWWITKIMPIIYHKSKDLKKITSDTWAKLKHWWKFTEPYTYTAFYACQVINTVTGLTTIPYRFTTWLQEKADTRLKAVVERKTALPEELEYLGE